MECALLNAGGQRRGEAASLALGGGGPVCGARSGGSHSVDHERAVFAGDPGCLSAGVETPSFLVGLQVVPFVSDKGENLFGGVCTPSELCETWGRKLSPQAAAAMS